MKNVPLESSIVNRILAWLNKQPGCYAIKTHGGRWSSGQPDVIGCLGGKMLALEVKRPGGKATKLQLAILAKWEAAGATVGVVYGLDDVKHLLRQAIKEKKEARKEGKE